MTQFPQQISLQFVVFDHYDSTCPPQVENTSGTPHLTRAMMASMHLYLYWKHGVELRPIADVVPKYFSVDPILADRVGAGGVKRRTSIGETGVEL